jgi:hypothetical protein
MKGERQLTNEAAVTAKLPGDVSETDRSVLSAVRAPPLLRVLKLPERLIAQWMIAIKPLDWKMPTEEHRL